jgi:uncharacterized protein YdcH (DUF465 family)
MLQLNSKYLTVPTNQHLASVQKSINKKTTFTDKSDAALTSWKKKTDTKDGKTAFNEIKLTLTGMCIGKGICNYCEANEATDIEHVRPKSLFPQHSFIWQNYILACKTCNMTYKGSKVSIFYPRNSNIVQNITPSSKNALKLPPANTDTLLINPHTEDPTTFIRLDLVGGTFNYIPIQEEGTREYLRADYTINTILKLNDRQALVEARKSAFRNFQNLLKNYIKVSKATNYQELEEATGDHPQVNHLNSISDEINRIQTNIKNAIQNHVQPTVWFEMKRQRAKLKNTNQLFEQLPAALKW